MMNAINPNMLPEFPSRQESLVGQIASDIAREIRDGLLKAGTRLNTVELAARFRTSRTPVREALVLLEQEGLIEIPPRKRPRVATISMREVEELYKIRGALNTLLIRGFIEKATPNLLLGMDALFDDLVEAAGQGNADAVRYARAVLHDYWVDHCDNPSLRKLLRTCKTRLSVKRLAGDFALDTARVVRDHEMIRSACHSRDYELGEAVIRAMTRHGLESIRRTHAARDAAT